MKKRRNIQYILLLITIVFYSSLMAQGTWKVYTKDDGLKSNNISHIYKDSKGNLWFNTGTTLKGIIKFDGKNWTNYYNKNNLVLITTFFEDSQGTVWLGTRSAKYIMANGLYKIDGSTFERISKVGTKFIIEDSDGKIWFGGKKLGSYDGNSITEYSKKELGKKKITAIHSNSAGNILIGTKNGISVFDGENWNRISNVPNCPTKQVNSIISDSNGHTWFGTEDGVYKYDGNIWQHFTIADGLVADGTLMLRMDSKNNIYAIAGKPAKESIGIGIVDITNAASTSLAKSGLSIFKNGTWSAFSDVPGVPDNLRPVFIEDKSGNLWFNSSNKSIYKFDGVTWTSYNKNNGFRLNSFSTMIEDSKGNYWFGSGSGIVKLDRQTWSNFTKDSGLHSNLISSIVEDDKGNIWFGTFKGVVKYTP